MYFSIHHLAHWYQQQFWDKTFFTDIAGIQTSPFNSTSPAVQAYVITPHVSISPHGVHVSTLHKSPYVVSFFLCPWIQFTDLNLLITLSPSPPIYVSTREETLSEHVCIKPDESARRHSLSSSAIILHLKEHHVRLQITIMLQHVSQVGDVSNGRDRLLRKSAE